MVDMQIFCELRCGDIINIIGFLLLLFVKFPPKSFTFYPGKFAFEHSFEKSVHNSCSLERVILNFFLTL